MLAYSMNPRRRRRVATDTTTAAPAIPSNRFSFSDIPPDVIVSEILPHYTLTLLHPAAASSHPANRHRSCEKWKRFVVSNPLICFGYFRRDVVLRSPWVVFRSLVVFLRSSLTFFVIGWNKVRDLSVEMGGPGGDLSSLVSSGHFGGEPQQRAAAALDDRFLIFPKMWMLVSLCLRRLPIGTVRKILSVNSFPNMTDLMITSNRLEYGPDTEEEMMETSTALAPFQETCSRLTRLWAPGVSSKMLNDLLLPTTPTTTTIQKIRSHLDACEGKWLRKLSSPHYESLVELEVEVGQNLMPPGSNEMDFPALEVLKVVCHCSFGRVLALWRLPRIRFVQAIRVSDFEVVGFERWAGTIEEMWLNSVRLPSREEIVVWRRLRKLDLFSVKQIQFFDNCVFPALKFVEAVCQDTMPSEFKDSKLQTLRLFPMKSLDLIRSGKNLTCLERLEFSGLDDSIRFARFAPMPALSQLKCRQCLSDDRIERLTAALIRHACATSSSGLKKVELDQSPFLVRSNLGSIGVLEILRVEKCTVAYDFFLNGVFQNLSRLSLISSEVPGFGGGSSARFPSLNYLRILDCQVNDSLFSAPDRFPKLGELCLQGGKLQCAGIDWAPFPHLWNLHIVECSSLSLNSLFLIDGRFPELFLFVYESTASGVLYFEDWRLPKLKRVKTTRADEFRKGLADYGVVVERVSQRLFF